MAMGQRGQEQARNALRSERPFQSSTGSLRGTQGSTRNLGWLADHPEKMEIRRLLAEATYVVWSYDTPIGWVVEDEVGNSERYYVDVVHTVTTSHHQSLLRYAWGEFTLIGSGPEVQRRSAPVRPRFVPEFNDRSASRPDLDRLLDRRFADPDWSPGLPEGAEERDAVRVARDLTRGPVRAHP